MSTLRNILAIAALVSLATTSLAGTYTAGGTFVAKTQLGTILDNGGVICEGVDGDGIGGGCLLFPEDPAEVFLNVTDVDAGQEVAFQVCVDNDGDGICGGPQNDPFCFDQIFFSHDDEGNFFNPLGPLPTEFLPGCTGGFAGWVVLLCQGVHEVDGDPHTHGLTTGSIQRAYNGTGYGDFCGGGAGGNSTGQVNAAAKAYRIV